MGPLLSTSKISPFLVPTKMWPWPSDMARMEGLSSKSNPVEIVEIIIGHWGDTKCLIMN